MRKLERRYQKNNKKIKTIIQNKIMIFNNENKYIYKQKKYF